MLGRSKSVFLLVFLGTITIVALRSNSDKEHRINVGRLLPPGKVAPQLLSFWDAALLLAPDGSLWTWGGTGFQLMGQMGQKTITQTPRRIGSDSDWMKVSSSAQFTIAQKADGSLWGWGMCQSGQLGDLGTNRHVPKPVRIGSSTNWVQFSVGAGHCVALDRQGSIWAWGQNEHGQVGDGTTSNKFGPVLISQDKDWKAVCAGSFNSFAIKHDGTAWGWGLDGQNGGTNDDLAPRQLDPDTNWLAIVASNYHLVGLKRDGTLWLRGQNAHSTAPAYVTTPVVTFVQIGKAADWREVYCGQNSFFARKADGSWWVCGDNRSGQLGLGNTGTFTASGLVGSPGRVDSPRKLAFNFEPWAFAVGNETTVLLTKDGVLWTWGWRLGTPPFTSPNRWQQKVNNVLSRLPRSPRFFKFKPSIDWTPYRLWELPREQRCAPPS